MANLQLKKQNSDVSAQPSTMDTSRQETQSKTGQRKITIMGSKLGGAL